MSGNKIFLDTNILLYLLGGDTTIAELLNGKQFYIAFITQLELLGYSELDSKQEEIIDVLLSFLFPWYAQRTHPWTFSLKEQVLW